MREHSLTLPQLALIVATRGIAAFGAGVLLASRIGKRRVRLVGYSMLAVGALSTIPIAIKLFRKSDAQVPNGKRPHATASAHA